MAIELNVEEAKKDAAALRALMKRIDDTRIFQDEREKIWLELDKEDAAKVLASLMLACNSCEEFIQAAEVARKKAKS